MTTILIPFGLEFSNGTTVQFEEFVSVITQEADTKERTVKTDAVGDFPLGSQKEFQGWLKQTAQDNLESLNQLLSKLTKAKEELEKIIKM
jgi:hypothetical protein